VKLAAQSNRGQKSAIAILCAGDSFGEGCLEGNSHRTYTATSVKKSSISRISKASVTRQLRVDPAFAKQFVSFSAVQDRATGRGSCGSTVQHQ
jgi:CRP/FNR family transcriptional regulator, cyclic AMP receptor protein